MAKAEKKAPKKKLKVIKKTTKDLELAGKKKGPPGRSPFVSAPDPD